MSDSNQETEVKFYVCKPQDIEMRLRPPSPFGRLPPIRNKTFQKLLSFYSRIWGRLGAGLIQPRVHELNLRFDNSNGDFQREGRVLRLRRDHAVRLTYKDNSRVLDGMIAAQAQDAALALEVAVGIVEA